MYIVFTFFVLLSVRKRFVKNQNTKKIEMSRHWVYILWHFQIKRHKQLLYILYKELNSEWFLLKYMDCLDSGCRLMGCQKYVWNYSSEKNLHKKNAWLKVIKMKFASIKWLSQAEVFVKNVFLYPLMFWILFHYSHERKSISISLFLELLCM